MASTFPFTQQPIGFLLPVRWYQTGRRQARKDRPAAREERGFALSAPGVRSDLPPRQGTFSEKKSDFLLAESAGRWYAPRDVV
jgi:hypothetical protein